MENNNFGIEKENKENCPHCGSNNFYQVDENFSKEYINLIFTCEKCKEGFMRVYKFAWTEY